MEKFMGIDVGGTNIKIGIVDTDGQMEYKIKYPTAALKESDDFVGGFLDILEKELGKFPEIQKIGIASPGTHSKDRSKLLEIAAIPMLDGVELKSILLNRFPGKEFFLENDANAAALGEYYFSGTKIPENYIFITLGTGVGSAAIIDHKIFIGGDGNGMELGHVLSNNGKELEVNIGKRGIVKRAKKLAKKKNSKLKNYDLNEPKQILKAAVRGDETAIKIWEEVGEYLGEALVAAIRLLDIKTILIGGGLAAGFDLIIGPMEKLLKETLTPYYVKDLLIKRAALGNNAGIIGAASLCFK